LALSASFLSSSPSAFAKALGHSGASSTGAVTAVLVVATASSLVVACGSSSRAFTGGWALALGLPLLADLVVAFVPPDLGNFALGFILCRNQRCAKKKHKKK
jgi:hypothetical protein